MTAIDAEIAAIARRQLALITLDDARAAGLTARQVQVRVSRGSWARVRPGVYVVNGAPPTFEQAALAAVLAARQPAVVSHHTAAKVWGLRHAEPAGLDVLLESPSQLRIPGVELHRTRAWFDEDLTRHRGVPVTSVARTIVELSGTLTPFRLGQALDGALRARLVAVERVARCIGRLPPAPGRRPTVVHEVLARRLPGYDPGESDLETRALHAIVAAGLPAPRQQHRVEIDGRRFRIDLAYPDLRIAIELDGWDPHGTDRSVFDGDRFRQNDIVLDGWHVLRFTSKTTDAQIVAAVRTALDRFDHSATA